MTSIEAYYWTTILVCIGVFQMSLADLLISIKHGAIMNFRIASESLVSRYAKVFNFVFDGLGAWLFKVLMLCCAAACIALVLLGQNPKFLLTAILIIHLLSYPRWRYFVSSDSPLFRAILVALLLHYYIPSSKIITEAGLLFIAGYVALIYHLTAIQKLKSKFWRNGLAIENYMNRFPFWRMVSPATTKPSWLLKLTSWSVILFELCFFIGLLFPEAGFVLMTVGLLFHASLSFSVGINHFFWTFLSCYPAYIYTGMKVFPLLFSSN
jgi:hypothetical protein